MLWCHFIKMNLDIHFHSWDDILFQRSPSFYFLVLAICGSGTVSSWNEKENGALSRSGLLLKLLFYFLIFNFNHKYVSFPIKIHFFKIKIWGSKLYFFLNWWSHFYPVILLLLPPCTFPVNNTFVQHPPRCEFLFTVFPSKIIEQNHGAL